MNMDLSLLKPCLPAVRYGDSISNFQSELERMADKAQYRAQKKYLERKRRVYTENS